jgi:tetratricopeptide (TPR) repeat protein
VLQKLKEEGRNKKVIRECEKALRRYPHDILLRKLLAEAYLDEGRLIQAETELQKVTTEIDELASAYKLEAELLFKLNKTEKASQALNRYLAGKPDDSEALDLQEKISALSKEGMSDEQVEEMKTPESLEQEDELIAFATPTMAEIYYDQGEKEKAIDTYQQVLLENPDDEKTKRRLMELTHSIEQEPLKTGVPRTAKREKLISILESWLTNLEDMHRVP